MFKLPLLAFSLFLCTSAIAARDSGGAPRVPSPQEKCRTQCNGAHPDDDEAFEACVKRCNRPSRADNFLSLVELANNSPGYTACQIRCHNLHPDDEAAEDRCVRTNCTDNN